jgi:membrane-bound lytic murein transglycosylase B
LSKQQEKEYAKALAEKQARAAKIRSALFNLRDTSAIEFGDALAYANEASKSTGVRPALILAILTQESNLGKNVGGCYLRESPVGSGVSKKTGNILSNVMHPTRDVPVFISFMGDLSRDPYNTLVSCPQSIGYGGAMGPSQFIASTWKLFINRIRSITGRSVADPWNPQDAITATSLYLGDLGATGGSYSGERNAACKYYSGKICSRSTLATSYGNSVMRLAGTIQANIDILQGI